MSAEIFSFPVRVSPPVVDRLDEREALAHRITERAARRLCPNDMPAGYRVVVHSAVDALVQLMGAQAALDFLADVAVLVPHHAAGPESAA